MQFAVLRGFVRITNCRMSNFTLCHCYDLYVLQLIFCLNSLDFQKINLYFW